MALPNRNAIKRADVICRGGAGSGAGGGADTGIMFVCAMAGRTGAGVGVFAGVVAVVDGVGAGAGCLLHEASRTALAAAAIKNVLIMVGPAFVSVSSD